MSEELKEGDTVYRVTIGWGDEPDRLSRRTIVRATKHRLTLSDKSVYQRKTMRLVGGGTRSRDGELRRETPEALAEYNLGKLRRKVEGMARTIGSRASGAKHMEADALAVALEKLREVEAMFDAAKEAREQDV